MFGKKERKEFKYPGVRMAMDGNTAVIMCEREASDAAGAYPITPSTQMGEYWAEATASGHITEPSSTQAHAVGVASFTSACTDLNCSFDASGSSDLDGTITSYAWNFGDGSAGQGVQVAHTYAAAGTYPVTLTVTDDGGATGTLTANVTVTAPAVAPAPAPAPGPGPGGRRR